MSELMSRCLSIARIPPCPRTRCRSPGARSGPSPTSRAGRDLEIERRLGAHRGPVHEQDRPARLGRSHRRLFPEEQAHRSLRGPVLAPEHRRLGCHRAAPFSRESAPARSSVEDDAGSRIEADPHGLADLERRARIRPGSGRSSRRPARTWQSTRLPRNVMSEPCLEGSPPARPRSSRHPPSAGGSRAGSLPARPRLPERARPARPERARHRPPRSGPRRRPRGRPARPRG
jgi:hypothetical protein